MRPPIAKRPSRRCLAFFCSLAVLLALLSSGVLAAETPIPPVPSRWVTDSAGFLSAPARESLDARLQAFEGSTKHQVLVYIADTTGGVPLEDWAVRAVKAWGVGRKGMDDGLVLFIMARDRKLRIEVGYGLEPVMPDAIASRIVNEILMPAIRSGNNDAAVSSGVDSILSVLSGGAAPPPQAAAQRGQNKKQPVLTLPQKIGYGIGLLFILWLIVTHPYLAMMFLLSGGRGSGRNGGGGFGGGGGGFSGGGGMSGGGGASGSW